LDADQIQHLPRPVSSPFQIAEIKGKLLHRRRIVVTWSARRLVGD
jgi:hypothetical protein